MPERESDLTPLATVMGAHRMRHGWPPETLAPGVTMVPRRHQKRDGVTEVDEEAARLQRIVELSAAFEPASIAGLTRRYWDIAGEIRELERERANLGVILTEHIEATGEVIQVDGLPALRLVGTYRWIGTTAVEERRLRFDRKGSST